MNKIQYFLKHVKLARKSVAIVKYTGNPDIGLVEKYIKYHQVERTILHSKYCL